MHLQYKSLLGVEWDNQTRGKHDGSCIVDGVFYKYFNCKMGAGSFVKPSKLASPLTLNDALTLR